jgi:hypothetical protein
VSRTCGDHPGPAELYFFFLAVLGMEPRAWCMAKHVPYH